MVISCRGKINRKVGGLECGIIDTIPAWVSFEKKNKLVLFLYWKEGSVVL